MTFTGCYFESGLTQMSSYPDSVSVGRLAAGTYTLSFVGAQVAGGTPGSQQCTAGPRDTVSITFQVRTALATRTASAGWAVYPVPAAGRSLSLLVPAAKAISSLQLVDLAGREAASYSGPKLVRPNNRCQVELPENLASGSYTLKIHVVGEGLVTQRLLLP